MNIHNLYRPQNFVLVLLMTGCLFLNGCAEKTHKKKVYRVGILSGLDYFSMITDGFKEKMTELGYIEGKNIVYDIQKTNLEPEKERQILGKFMESKVDLILTFPTEVSLVAKAATAGTNIPLVFAAAFTEETGLVDRISHPGGHITGVRYPGPDNAVKRLETMLELIPQAKRIWIPYMRGYPAVPSQIEVLHQAAAPDVTLVEMPTSDPAEFNDMLRAQAKADGGGPDAILCINEPIVGRPDFSAVLGKFAAEYKTPVGGSMATACDDCFESVFALVVDNIEVGRLAASIADKIFEGAQAGTMMVATPPSYLKLNYKLAQELGLEVPKNLLARAEEIIH